MIRNYSDYKHFSDQGRGKLAVHDELRIAVMESTRRAQARKIKTKSDQKLLQDTRKTLNHLHSEYCDKAKTISDSDSIPVVLSKLDLSEDAINDAFWAVREFVEPDRPLARAIASLFYVVGLVFVLAVIAQNVITVWRVTNFKELFLP